jgi:hypothetical protein
VRFIELFHQRFLLEAWINPEDTDDIQFTDQKSPGAPAGVGSQVFKQMAKDAAKPYGNEHGHTPILLDVEGAMRGMQQFKRWKNWYARHEQIVHRLFGPDTDTFYKFLAIASIHTGPYQNAQIAVDAFLHWKNGGTFENWRRSGNRGVLPAQIAQFVKLQHDPWFIPTGRKVKEFYDAVRGDYNAVAGDRWMMRMCFGDVGATDRRVLTVKRLCTAWAKRLGWKPAEVQAALWCWYKRPYRRFYGGTPRTRAGDRAGAGSA